MSTTQNKATEIVISVAVKDDDTPVRPIADIIDDILAARVPDVVEARAAYSDDYGRLIQTGPGYLA